MTRTIAKNRTKKIAEIFENATACTAYTLDNGFTGHVCEKKWALKALNDFSFAKLRDKGNGHFSVNVHSNSWYELS